jgi:hypothetical protein
MIHRINYCRATSKWLRTNAADNKNHLTLFAVKKVLLTFGNVERVPLVCWLARRSTYQNVVCMKEHQSAIYISINNGLSPFSIVLW